VADLFPTVRLRLTAKPSPAKETGHPVARVRAHSRVTEPRATEATGEHSVALRAGRAIFFAFYGLILVAWV
jgi:hypothetical protein